MNDKLDTQINADIVTLTHLYEFSKKINVPMNADKIMECITAILKKYEAE